MFVATAALAIANSFSAIAAQQPGAQSPVQPQPSGQSPAAPPSPAAPGKGAGPVQDPQDPELAFDAATGQDLRWDRANKTWVDSKTGKPEPGGFKGPRAGDGTPVPPPPGHAEYDPQDPELAFDETTGQNLYWDRVNKTWTDSKTEEPAPGGFKGPRAGDGTPVPPPGNPAESTALPEVHTAKESSDDYGAGGYRETDTDAAGAVLEGRVYDAHGTLHEKTTEHYSVAGGSKHRTEKRIVHYDDRGAPTSETDFFYDVHGAVTSLDLIHFGLHGERSWEQTTEYQPTGFETKEWKAATHTWTTKFSPYAQPETAKPGAAPDAPKPAATPPGQAPAAPTSTNIGVLFPRDFHPGDTITGSLAPSRFAELFKSIPGLSEYSVPIQLYHLPDGSPQWSSVEIGVKGDGYIPVNPNGLFSVHIPMGWKGPLALQARQPDPMAGIGPSHAFLEIGDPVAAPELPQNLFSRAAKAELQYWMTADLIDLWNEAFDLENEIGEYYEGYGSPDHVDIGGLEEDLEDVYNDIDSLTARLPKEVVVKLARGLAQETREINEELRKGTLTADQKAELKECDDWASFLEDEADEANKVRLLASLGQIEPFWTSPVLTQNKLGALRGSFSGDSGDTLFKIDNFPITPLASTPDTLYFMPPVNLPAGLHSYQIDCPGMPETTLPVFYMTLTMWADQLNLHKGQSTTYHVKLDGLNGLPSSVWSSSFFPSDLVSPPELQGNQPSAQMPGPSLNGSITLSVTNQSPGTISMQNTFSSLDAKFFAPSGSYQLDGGVGAIMDGSFNILGVARAYLQPELGLGSTPGSPTNSTDRTSWTPGAGWGYSLPLSSGAAFTRSCPSSGLSWEPSASPHCMGLTASALYDQAVGNQNSATVGKSPTDDEIRAARSKEFADKEAAGKRVKEAQEKVDAAKARLEEKERTAAEAWDTAMDHISKDYPHAREEYAKTVERLRKAEEDRKKMLAAQQANPGPVNEKNVENAYDEKTAAWMSEGSFRDSLIRNFFSRDDRGVYQAASDALRQAQDEAAKAETELRDARAAQDALYF